MSIAATSGPALPPLLTGHACVPGVEPASIALQGAASSALGAGDFIWSMDGARASAAIVLEPEIPLAQACVMAPVLMVAIGDALGAIGPPNLAVTFRWPFTILANGAEVGRVGLLFPQEAQAANVPDFAIVTFDLAIATDTTSEPGDNHGRTALHLEGCGDLESFEILEAVARHFTTWVDTFGENGFGEAHESWMFRSHCRVDEMIDSPVKGRFLGLDEDGGLLVDCDGLTRGFSLLEAAK